MPWVSARLKLRTSRVRNRELAIRVLQLDLSEGRDTPAWSAELVEDRTTEVGYSAHDGKQRRRGPAFLLFLTSNTRRGD